jgi:hypothetical protein
MSSSDTARQGGQIASTAQCGGAEQDVDDIAQRADQIVGRRVAQGLQTDGGSYDSEADAQRDHEFRPQQALCYQVIKR